MPWIAKFKLKRRTHSGNAASVNHRRGELGSVSAVDALPAGPLADHPTFAYLFVTDMPDVLREGFFEFENDAAQTFAVGEIITGASGWTGEVFRVEPDRLTVKNIIGDPPARPGEMIAGSIAGAGAYFHFQFDLETISNWLHAPHKHSTRGTISVGEADGIIVVGDTITGSVSGASATITGRDGIADDRMDIVNLAGVVGRGSLITGRVSGSTARAALFAENILSLKDPSGPFIVGEVIDGVHENNWSATVVSEYERYKGILNVSNRSGNFLVGELASTPTVSCVIKTAFEGDDLARSKRFIPWSAVPAAKQNELRHVANGGQNWTSATFSQIKSLIKKRPADIDLVGKTDTVMDAEAEIDTGAPA